MMKHYFIFYAGIMQSAITLLKFNAIIIAIFQFLLALKYFYLF